MPDNNKKSYGLSRKSVSSLAENNRHFVGTPRNTFQPEPIRALPWDSNNRIVKVSSFPVETLDAGRVYYADWYSFNTESFSWQKETQVLVLSDKGRIDLNKFYHGKFLGIDPTRQIPIYFVAGEACCDAAPSGDPGAQCCPGGYVDCLPSTLKACISVAYCDSATFAIGTEIIFTKNLVTCEYEATVITPSLRTINFYLDVCSVYGNQPRCFPGGGVGYETALYVESFNPDGSYINSDLDFRCWEIEEAPGITGLINCEEVRIDHTLIVAGIDDCTSLGPTTAPIFRFSFSFPDTTHPHCESLPSGGSGFSDYCCGRTPLPPCLRLSFFNTNGDCSCFNTADAPEIDFPVLRLQPSSTIYYAAYNRCGGVGGSQMTYDCSTGVLESVGDCNFSVNALILSCNPLSIVAEDIVPDGGCCTGSISILLTEEATCPGGGGSGGSGGSG